jgi:hypothetical protein
MDDRGAKERERSTEDPAAKAMYYSLERCNEWTAYLYNCSLEIDNNLIANSIRPLALGWMIYPFAGLHYSTRRAVAIDSFFAKCRRRSV